MKRSGFTLIELSIVLIIIGLIIGAVIKGKDLINSADQKKIYNTWVKGWQVTFNTYQDRTGGILGDGAVNGGTATDPDGRCDNVRLDTTTTVQARLKAIGLDVPVSNIASSNGGAYSIKGKYTTSTANASLEFRNNENVLIIRNMPTDVAIAFDTMADGTSDPATGSFRKYGGNSKTWPDVSKTKTVNVSLEL